MSYFDGQGSLPELVRRVVQSLPGRLLVPLQLVHGGTEKTLCRGLRRFIGQHHSVSPDKGYNIEKGEMI